MARITHATIALALIAAAGLTACEALRDYHANNPDWGSNVPPYERIQFAGAHPTPDERARCEAAGGRIEMGGLMGHERCVQTYADAGKACTGSSDCLGQCILDSSHGSVPMGGAATGTCQVTDSPFGCYQTVEDGKAQPEKCVD